MKVKDLKRLLDDIPDDTEITVLQSTEQYTALWIISALVYQKMKEEGRI